MGVGAEITTTDMLERQRGVVMKMNEDVQEMKGNSGARVHSARSHSHALTNGLDLTEFTLKIVGARLLVLL